ncbi:16S rRNA (guanine(966)-N(2))-methyltransferase RsmD [Halomonas sp.]|uniref:16S rRNA (guanine(966)-N(2))-methyltransferase RsmD n=1 Tax=Halomonas sp. TaxID=1486246 RepID=UPI00384FC78C
MTRRSPSPRRTAKPADGHQGSRRSAGRLRIIGGDYRRRLLPVLDSPGLRPTPDRVRETLFNWLTADLLGARVLDVFAGTGALGLEALSRGAREARFVERDPHVARQLEENLAALGATARGRVVNADAMAFLAGPPTPCSLVFLDPPFRQGLAEPSCTALEAGWLADGALIYLECEAGREPTVPTTWRLHREVRAGDSHGRLYRRDPSPQLDAC